MYIECLDISGARSSNSFSNDSGSQSTYQDNAAAITIESGDHIYVRSNALHDCGNGLFSASESSNVYVGGNHIYDNGNSGSIFEHNSYTESDGITFEFNHYGPLCSGCGGNNLKDRSAGTVVRYNWIEAGNRQLDLVDSDHQELIQKSSYRSTFVYGNVLVEPDGAGNSQVVHYGGDSNQQNRYRAGTLYFHHNTVVSTRSGNTTLVRLSSSGETLDARNNIVYPSAGGGALAIIDGDGTANLADNWLPTGWKACHCTPSGSVNDNGNVEGADPGFANAGSADYTLSAGSAADGAAGSLASGASAHEPTWQYVKHTGGEARASHDDVGAFER